MRLPEAVLAHVMHSCDLWTLVGLWSINPALMGRVFGCHQRLIWGHREFALHSLEDMHVLLRYRDVMRHHGRLVCSQLYPRRRLPAMFSRLTELDFTGCLELTDEALGGFVREHGASLLALTLDGCAKLTNRAAELILRHARSLRGLSVRRCGFTHQGLAALIAIPTAKRLCLADAYLASFRRLEPGGNAGVEALDLSGNPALDRHYLAHFLLPMFPGLRQLRLVDNAELTVTDIRALGDAFPLLAIEHNARLLDESEAGVRAYIMSLVAVAPSAGAGPSC